MRLGKSGNVFCVRASILLTMTTILILSATMYGFAAVIPAGEEKGLTVVDTLVTVAGFHLNFRIIEGGSPTILLESGGGMDLTEWDGIAPELARRTGATVVSYDRAGFGGSDLPEIPCDIKVEAGWLWEGMSQLGYEDNIILAGHSYGGWMIRIEASENPDAVIGMVFIDPFSAELVDMLGAEYLDDHPMCGKLPFDISQPDKLTKNQRALARMVSGGLAPKMKIMKKTIVPGSIPVFIIKSTLQTFPKVEEQEAWDRALDQMAASIDGAVVVVAEESNHMIPFSQPDLIIDTIIKAVHLSGSESKGK